MTNPSSRHFRIRVCDGPSCGVTHGSEALHDKLAAAIEADPELAGRVGVCYFTCYGRCDDGPNLFVHELEEGDDPDDEPDDDVLESQRGFYPGMTEEKALRILAEHCKAGKVVEDLVDDY